MGMIIGINGSPRKNHNSAKLLEAALEGAAASGNETKLVHLTELHFSGCKSCFACKKLSGKSFGRCALRDDLQELLTEIVDTHHVTGIILSMPIYFGDVPGMVRNFMERLWFPGLLYDKNGKIAYNKSIRVGLIYTMNAPDPTGYDQLIQGHSNVFKWLLHSNDLRVMRVADTLQFDDYSQYSSSMFNVDAKKQHHDKTFSETLKKAYELGLQLGHNY